MSDEKNVYTFERVFWVIAWLQFASAVIMSLIEYLAANGFHANEVALTNLVINVLRSFNIIVIGAMIKFFMNIMDKLKTTNEVQAKEITDFTTATEVAIDKAKAVESSEKPVNLK